MPEHSKNIAVPPLPTYTIIGKTIRKSYHSTKTVRADLLLPTIVLLALQTTKRTIEQLTMYLQSHKRKGQWFKRFTDDKMYQINGEGLQHGRVDITRWGIPKYFMIKCVFKLMKRTNHTDRKPRRYYKETRDEKDISGQPMIQLLATHHKEDLYNIMKEGD
eukprot:215885-Amphidinium_carterae.3